MARARGFVALTLLATGDRPPAGAAKRPGVDLSGDALCRATEAAAIAIRRPSDIGLLLLLRRRSWRLPSSRPHTRS